MFQNLIDAVNLQQLATQLAEFLPRLLIAIATVVLTLLFLKLTRNWLKKALSRAKFDRVLIVLLVDNAYFYSVLTFGVIMALGQLGVNVTAALAGLGVAGIAIGFAAQDTVANFIAGILIFWDKPFIVGDWIETEGQYGKVTNITLRTTRIRTPKNTYIVIPNKRIIDEVLENYSKHGEFRVEVPVGIAYKEDIDKARAAILKAADTIDSILIEPKPDVIVHELGDSSVNLKVRVWVDNAQDNKKTYFALTEAAKKALDGAGIEIPFPHLQLFVDNVEDRVWDGAAATIGKQSRS